MTRAEEVDEARGRVLKAIEDFTRLVPDASSPLHGPFREMLCAFMAADKCWEESDEHLRKLHALTSQSIDAWRVDHEKRKVQQSANSDRRRVDDGFLKDASDRHLAGESWKEIAADYAINHDNLRKAVVEAGHPTRGRKRRR